MTDLARLVVTLEAQTAQYQAELERAQAKLANFGGAMNKMLDGLVARMAAAFAVDRIVAFGASLIENAAHLERMAESSGVAIETLSGLQFAAKMSGVETDGLGIALRKLNVSISQAGDPATKAAAAFRIMGLNLKDIQTQSSATTLGQLADKFASYEDGANKTALAVQLFGRAGEQLIPLLNKGAGGIAELEQKAADLGITLDEKTGKAAEAFEQQLIAFKAQASGAGLAIAKDLLPVLSDLLTAFTAARGGADKFAGGADILAGALKGLATAASAFATGLRVIATNEAMMWAAQDALLHGHFKAAAEIFKSGGTDLANISRAGNVQLAAIWHAGSADILSEVTITAKMIKDKAPDLAGGEALKKAMDEAVKSLTASLASLQQKLAGIDASGLKKSEEATVAFSLSMGVLAEKVRAAGAEGPKLAAAMTAAAHAIDLKTASADLEKLAVSLREQIAMFGMSKGATDAYKLSTGELGAEIARLGPAGAAARAQLTALDLELERHESAAAIAAVADQVGKLKGQLGDAGAAAFDLQHQMLAGQLADTGNTAAAAQLADLRQLTIDQAKYNDLQQQAARIEADLANAEQKIANARAAGSINDLTAMQQEDAARTDALGQLSAVNTQMQAIAASSNNPALVQGAAKFGTSLVTLANSAHQLGTTIRTDLEDSFSSAVASVLDGTATMGSALKSFLKNFEADLAKLAAKSLTQSLLGGALGATGGSGGWIAALGGMISGKAAGGPINANIPVLVGEHGPEIIVPGMSATVIPNNAIRPISSIVQHFNFPPGATVSRDTQMQIAASAARGLGVANRRNN